MDSKPSAPIGHDVLSTNNMKAEQHAYVVDDDCPVENNEGDYQANDEYA